MGNEASAPRRIDGYVEIQYRIRCYNGGGGTLVTWRTNTDDVAQKNAFVMNAEQRQYGFSNGCDSPVSKVQIILIFSKNYVSGFLSDMFEKNDIIAFANFLPDIVDFEIYAKDGLVFTEKDIVEIKTWAEKFKSDVEKVDKKDIILPSMNKREYNIRFNESFYNIF